MRLTQGDKALALLGRLSVEQLLAGLEKGRVQLVALGDPADYATAVNRTVGHPNFEMRETTRGREFYGKAFGELRLNIEVAMIDTYEELVRRGGSFNRASVRMLYLTDWKLPR